MYSIGDKLEVATKMLTREIVLETKVMTVTEIYPHNGIDNKDFYMYSFDNNPYIHYPEKRILRKVE